MEGRATGDFFQHRYYRINTMILKVSGQWPYLTTRTRCILCAGIVLLGISQLIPEVLAVVKHLDDQDYLIKCVTPMILAGFCLVKFLFSALNTNKILMLLNRMRTDWDVWARDRDVNTLHEYAKEGRKITILGAVGAFIACVLFEIQPIVPKIIDILLENGTEPGEFAIPVDYVIIDEQKHFFYIVLHQFMVASMTFTIVVGHDAFIGMSVHHACGLFAALGVLAFLYELVTYRRIIIYTQGELLTSLSDANHEDSKHLKLGAIGLDTEKYGRINVDIKKYGGIILDTENYGGIDLDFDNPVVYDLVTELRKLERFGKTKRSAETHEIGNGLGKPGMDFNDVTLCIDRHNEAIEYAELIEATYSSCLFFSMGFQIFLITLTGLQVVTTKMKPHENLRFIVNNVVITIHLFVECYVAQLMIDHSISIRYRVLSSEWYRLPLKIQKSLLLMIMRCNVPCMLTAGKVSAICIETFGLVMKTSLSYFTVLRSL